MEYKYKMTCDCGASAGYNNVESTVVYVDTLRTLRARCICPQEVGGI
tara:strand:- start:1482 stop:1622 length:141 start_codon:yes stop_codon:yes gene_type:complete